MQSEIGLFSSGTPLVKCPWPDAYIDFFSASVPKVCLFRLLIRGLSFKNIVVAWKTLVLSFCGAFLLLMFLCWAVIFKC